MTVRDVIANVDKFYVNTIDHADKVRWLKKLDQQVYEEIILTHELPTDFEEPNFTNYGDSTELMVDDLRVDIYESYLKMRIAHELCEQKRYNLEKTDFNNLYITYQADYNRHHMPVSYIPNYS